MLPITNNGLGDRGNKIKNIVCALIAAIQKNYVGNVQLYR